VGLHTGECEVTDEDDYSGLAVHIGALVAALAGPGEVLVSSTVKDLVAGFGLRFSDGSKGGSRRVAHQCRSTMSVGMLAPRNPRSMSEGPTAEDGPGSLRTSSEHSPRIFPQLAALVRRSFAYEKCGKRERPPANPPKFNVWSGAARED